MSVDNPNCPYLLIIDTDKYAGNFERQLTAFCTGADDGSHGEPEGNDFRYWLEDEEKTSKWEKLVTSCNDEDIGYPRVCTIWPTTGRYNNGSGFHYDAGADETEPRAKAKESAINYFTPLIKVCEDRLDNEDFQEDNGGRGWTKEVSERTIAGYLESIAKAGTGSVQYPAYESVAIFLSEKPTEADMAIFVERLREFSENMMHFGKRTGKKLTIKAVKLLTHHQNYDVVEEYSL